MHSTMISSSNFPDKTANSAIPSASPPEGKHYQKVLPLHNGKQNENKTNANYVKCTEKNDDIKKKFAGMS